LNYYSQHLISKKRGTVLSLVDRAFLLSHPEFHEKNLKFVIDTLLNNDYPLKFIFRVMSDRIKSLVHSKTNKQKKILPDNNDTQMSKWFSIPYISNVSEKFKNITAGSQLKLFYHSLNKLSRIIKVHKDPLLNSQKKNVVYKISCNDCDASYVGQTGRMLKTRISEHQNHIRRNTSTTFVITNHRVHHDHEFGWNNVEVLDVERFYYKRISFLR